MSHSHTGEMLCLGGLCHIPNRVRFADHKTKRVAFGFDREKSGRVHADRNHCRSGHCKRLRRNHISKAEALSQSAALRAIEDGVRELISREMVTWADIKLSDQGWVDDATVFARVDADLGAAFRWTPQADTAGGRLHFKDVSVNLTRAPSQNTAAGRWTSST
jgi:hypothetical protein